MTVIYSPGATVLIGPGIRATVLSVSIRGSAIQYCCAWWDDHDRHTDWLEACEVEPVDETTKLTVGGKKETV